MSLLDLNCFVIVAVALGAEVFECPVDETTGKFEDPHRCDQYWECFRGQAEKKNCSDGLAFDPKRVETQREPCDYIFNVDCTGREGLGEPQSTAHCERANGLFPHENDCGLYYSCKDGKETRQQCPPGLHFSLKTKTCDWETVAGRGGNCKVLRSLGNFTCDPDVDYFTKDNQKISNPTFANYDDCALFYVCKNGIQPAIAKCDAGLVFNDIEKKCDLPINVPDW